MKQFLQLIGPFREMRKIVALCFVMVMAMGAAWGQNTHTIGWGTASGEEGTYTNFTDISGTVAGVCSFEAVKNSSGSNPAYNASASELRLYYNNGGDGGSIIITPVSGVTITGAEMTTSTSPSVAYYVDGGDAVSVSASDNTYTISNIAASTSLEIQNVNTTNTQLRIKTIALTYTTSGTQPESYTVTFDAGDGTFVGSTDFPNVSNTVTAGTYTLPSAEKSGYTFDGWLETGTTTPVTGSYAVSDDVDFTAQYTEISSGGNLMATLTATNLELTGSYTTNTEKIIDGITYVYTDLMKNSDNIQAKASSGTIKNATAYPGDIISVVITHSGTARATTINGSADGTNWTQVETGSGSINADFSGRGYKYFQITRGSNAAYWEKIEVTYSTESSSLEQSDLTITNQSTDLSFDLYSNSAAQTISYTTSSTGAITITPESPTSYFSYVHDAAAKTITITPLAVTPGAQTVTISQEADDDYFAGVATFTVSVINSDPNVPGTVNNPYTVADAIANTPSSGNVYIQGVVSSFYNTSIVGDGSNYRYYISDDGTTTTELLVYKGKGLNETTFTSADDLLVGDEVVIYGTLVTYQNAPEVASGNYLYSWNRPAAAVEAPTFSPAAGTYAEAQEVTISCETPDAAIYYTLDGTEPTDASTPYTAAIEVLTTTTIKAIAYVGSDASTVATATYHINSLDNPYTVTDALAFNEYPANGIYVNGIVSTAPTQAPTNNGELTYYISVDGEATDELEVYKGKGLEQAAFTAQDDIQVGDIVTVYGNVQVFHNTIEFGSGNYLVSFERPSLSEPSVTVTPATINAPAEGADGTLALTYENITDFISFDFYFCDAEGEELQEDPDWIYAEINEEDDTYSLNYLIDPNDGAARTAYFKVYTFDDDMEEVYAIVTVNQDRYVADYATLPFAFDGTSSDVENTDGLTQEGLGNYSSAPHLKFDGTGDWMVLHFIEKPGTLTFDIKGNSFSGGTFTVQTSEDGNEYTDLATYTELDNSQSEEFNNLGAGVRYIKWVYTEKDAGNVALGNIMLTAALIEPTITLEENLVEVEAEGGDGALAVTYNDVETDLGASIYWYDANGDPVADGYDWIVAELNDDMNVEYLIEANQGESRTAYFKVYALGVDESDVYSDLVTVTQAAPIAVTVTITGHSSTLDYDGEEHSVSGYDVTAIEIDGVATDLYTESDFTFGGTAYAARTAAGTTYMDLSEAQFTNTNANFSVTFDVTDGYQTIEKAAMTITVTGATGTVFYNGSEQSVEGYTLACESTLFNETLVSYDGTAKAKGTDVGVYPMNLDADQFSYGNENIEAEFVVTDGWLEIASCYQILVDADNPTWIEDFEAEGAAAYTGDLYTGKIPGCWSVPVQYTGASMDQIGEGIDTLPQIYHSFNTTEGGQYSLRMHFRSLLAMPELDENVDLGKVRLSMYVRQSYWRYQLQIGIITDMENPEESFVPVALVNNPDKTKTYFECGFSSVKDLVGAGRYIAFKNIGSNANDPYAVNYLDDVTLTYVNVDNLECQLYPGIVEDFERYTNLNGATGVEPDCWEVIHEDVSLESTTKPQLYRGYNSTDEGHYSLRMKNRCIYAMPEFIEGNQVSDYVMTLKLRQPSNLYRLQVGVVNEEGEFYLVKTLKCSGTSLEQKSVDFTGCTGHGNRIAFRNVLVPGTGMSTDYFDYSYNYIDDINLSAGEEAKSELNAAEELNADIEEIAVYPNPTTGDLYIDAVGVQKVECYNQMGQLVRVYDEVRNSIDLNTLTAGVYTLRITVPQGVTVRKVVKK